MKKQLLFIASFLLSLGVNAQAVWVSQATGFTPVSSGVRNVSVVDSNTLWIASYDGSGGMANRTDYSRTTDGGATWVAGTVPATAGYNWSMINAVDANNAWAIFYNGVAGAGGGIWHTSDGGASWAQQGVGTIFNASSFPDVVYFWDANTGVAMGDPNPTDFEIYTTADGGATWTPVPGANIPDALSGEYGIVASYAVYGNTIWFGSTKGRVFKSTDFGATWTMAVSGITVLNNASLDLGFYSATNGIARYYDATAGTNSMAVTTDGGATWSPATPTGNFWGTDFKYVPGTTSRFVSTGAAPGFIGSSYSDDGGLTWIDIEMLAQRTALGIYDSTKMWAGGFTTSPSADGIYRYYASLPTVACTDPSVSAGTAIASDSVLCFGDTLTVTSSGVVAPTTGTYSGVSWVITNADISGTSDPLNTTFLLAAYTFNYPAPSNSLRQFVNDGTFLPAGIYYWTPVVFANAAAVTVPPVFLNDLALDATCTLSGTSLMVNVLAAGDPLCSVGIPEIAHSSFSVNAYFTNNNVMYVKFINNKNDKAVLSIYDVTGRKVFTNTYAVTNGVSNESVNVQNLGAGTYIIKAETGSSSAVSKIVKM